MPLCVRFRMYQVCVRGVCVVTKIVEQEQHNNSSSTTAGAVFQALAFGPARVANGVQVSVRGWRTAGDRATTTTILRPTQHSKHTWSDLIPGTPSMKQQRKQ